MKSVHQHPLAQAVVGVLLAGSSSVLAQGDARTTMLEEVIVTAQKRAESLQEAPISMAAFSSQRLDNMGFTDIGDLQHSVPNLSMREMPSSKAAMRTYIRGVGNNDAQASQDPAIAIYLDGIYIARSTGLIAELTDVERIEVLRGPQGTLYGRNATGGAINIHSRAPAGEFGLKQKFTAGNRGLWRSQTIVDLPEVADLSAQLAYVRGAVDGWVKNRGEGVDFNQEKREALRLALRWQPLDELTIDYAYDRSSLDFGSHFQQTLMPSSVPGVPWSHKRIRSATPAMPFEESHLRISGHSLITEWSASDALTIKSLTGYRELKERLYQDYGPNPLAPHMFANAPYDTDQDQFSQEFQFLGQLDGTGLDYVAGLYYFEESAKEVISDYTMNIPLQDRKTRMENSAWAAYGQLTWTPPILDHRLHLTAGARYSEDKRKIRGDRTGYVTGESFSNERASHSWDNWSYSLIASWDVSDTSSAYAKYTQGYRTGGFNGRAELASVLQQKVDEELVDSVEVGYKAQWLDNRLRTNLAVFAMDYDDMQLSFADDQDVSKVTFFNAARARISGAELDLSAVLFEGMVANFQYAYLDADIRRVKDPYTGERARGYRLPSAPRSSYSFDLDYSLPTPSIGILRANLNYSWRDKVATTANIGMAPESQISSYGLVNARVALSEIPLVTTGNLELAVWGRNLEDKQYLVDNVTGFPWSRLLGVFGEPRSYGVEVMYHY